MTKTKTKTQKIVYWIATIWLSLGMLSTGIVQLLRLPSEVELMNRTGYPLYFLTIIGAWKVLGVAAILVPNRPLLKEWAYAGFFFVSTGAVFSHIACGHPLTELFGPILLVVLTLVSWYYRAARTSVPTSNP